jgi:hypothetical protein
MQTPIQKPNISPSIATLDDSLKLQTKIYDIKEADNELYPTETVLEGKDNDIDTKVPFRNIHYLEPHLTMSRKDFSSSTLLKLKAHDFSGMSDEDLSLKKTVSFMDDISVYTHEDWAKRLDQMRQEKTNQKVVPFWKKNWKKLKQFFQCK